jgi:hypothetical protein
MNTIICKGILFTDKISSLKKTSDPKEIENITADLIPKIIE